MGVCYSVKAVVLRGAAEQADEQVAARKQGYPQTLLTGQPSQLQSHFCTQGQGQK